MNTIYAGGAIVQTRTHRRYSPSQSERFLNCPGSVALLERVPARIESEYAIEGTKAHEVLDVALKNGVRRAIDAHRDYSSLCMEDFGSDFYHSIQVTLNYIYGLLDDYPDAVLFTEAHVNPPLPSAPGEGAGYCDVAIYIPSIATLFVIDFKHGSGVSKAAKGNTQCLQYAGGFLFEDNPKIDPATVDKVVAVIVQPRAFHVEGTIREHELTPYEVYEYLDRLDEGVRECQKPNAALVPGEDQCRFCDARTMCPAREAMGLQNAVSTTFKNIYDVKAPGIPDVHMVDIERIAYIMQWKPFLEKFLNDVEQHGRELMERGFNVTGFKLVETQARRKWYGDENAIAFKLAALARKDVTEVMEMKLISITDAERMVVEAFKSNVARGKKKQAAEDAKQLFAQLTLKQSSGTVTIAPVDDPRPAVNRAATIFSGVGELVQPPFINTEK